MTELCPNSPSCLGSDITQKEFLENDKYSFELGWHNNTVHKWDHCIYSIALPASYQGGLEYIPLDTNEVNSYVTYFETKEVKGKEVLIQPSLWSMDSNDLKIASDAQVYKKIMLPKPNGNSTNLQIIYVANTSIFWNGFNMKFERMSVN